MAESSQKEIQVRALTGESIVLHIPPTGTVHDLKLLLIQSFPPATNSPNFHLFTKGDKLRLQAQIGSYPIEHGEFLVLVPFTKKESTHTSKQDQFQTSTTSSNVAHSAPSSNLSESTWSDIAEYLSNLRGSGTTDSGPSNGDDNASNFEYGKFTSEQRKEKVVETTCSQFLELKTKWGFGTDKQMELPYHLILNTLQYTCEGALGEHNCKVFSKVLESVNCLSALLIGCCKLFKIACLKGGGGSGLYANIGSTCLCPAWLKIVMKAFAFINIFSAFLHLQHRKITSCLLEEALNQLGKFGVKLGLQDMKNLSLLCPQLVCFGNDIEIASFGNAIVVSNCSTSNKDRIGDNPIRGKKKNRECIFWW